MNNHTIEVDNSSNSARVPNVRRWRTSGALTSILIAALPSTGLFGATLKSETVIAWENYVRTADATLQDRVRPGGIFLWTFEDAGRASKVREGEIVVAQVRRQKPIRVPGGLIHHWIGAMFVPNVTVDQMLAVTRDYDHYKDFYRPSVVESRLIARDEPRDRWSMLLMNKAFFMKTALDADYTGTIARLDDRHVYTVSGTTRVQEVENYGEGKEHQIAEGEGSGYIWKLHGISRMEERDGGVYVELEAMALSRDIPAAFRFAAEPIVRRVSRRSMLVSLQQTQNALNTATR